MVVLAAAGIAEFFHWKSEEHEWRGRMAREYAGKQYLKKTVTYNVSRQPAKQEVMKLFK
jgi:hypothetical protein